MISDIAAGVLLTIAVVGGYFLSLVLHPWTKCLVCGGTKINRGLVYTYSHRTCWRCKGTGRKLRWGTRRFMPNRTRRLRGH